MSSVWDITDPTELTALAVGTKLLRRRTVHTVAIQQVASRWLGTCTCGASHLSVRKRDVDAWRRWHYREVSDA